MNEVTPLIPYNGANSNFSGITESTNIIIDFHKVIMGFPPYYLGNGDGLLLVFSY